MISKPTFESEPSPASLSGKNSIKLWEESRTLLVSPYLLLLHLFAQPTTGTKLHQQTRKAITKRKPALLAAIRKFNKYCDVLADLADHANSSLPFPFLDILAVN
jgi:hypothetical protein